MGIIQSFLYLGVSNFVDFNLIFFCNFLAPVVDQIKSADLLIRSAIMIKSSDMIKSVYLAKIINF